MYYPIISVVVSMYNVERYIVRCVTSIINQSFNNIEIIIVNDGSTDQSLKIVEENFSSECKIIIFSQTNQGLSCARNAGLNIAKGKYVAFIDGDDWIETTMLEEMYNNAILHDSDVVSCRLQYENIDNGTSSISGRNFTSNTISGEALLKDVLLGRSIQTSAAIKIYRTEWLKKNNLYFRPGLINEDVLYVLEIAYFANKISLVNKAFYHAVERTSSITRNFTEKNIDNILLALSFQKDFLLEHNIYIKYKEIFEASYIRQICFIEFQAAQRTKYKYFITLMKKLRKQSLYNIKLSRAVIKYLPIQLLIGILIQTNLTVCYCVVKILNRLGFCMH